MKQILVVQWWTESLHSQQIHKQIKQPSLIISNNMILIRFKCICSCTFVDLIQNDDKISEKKTYIGELSVLF